MNRTSDSHPWSTFVGANRNPPLFLPYEKTQKIGCIDILHSNGIAGLVVVAERVLHMQYVRVLLALAQWCSDGFFFCRLQLCKVSVRPNSPSSDFDQMNPNKLSCRPSYYSHIILEVIQSRFRCWNHHRPANALTPVSQFHNCVFPISILISFPHAVHSRMVFDYAQNL